MSAKLKNMPTGPERLKTPLLFPCAARVKMPQLGSEDSDLKGSSLKTSRYAPISVVFPTKLTEPVSKNYLSKISTDLSFDEDVVKERCFHAVPYDEKYLTDLFDFTGLMSPPPRAKIPVGRHNARGGDVRHMPCNLTKSSKPHLKPLKRKIMARAEQMHLEAVLREAVTERKKQEKEKKTLASVEEMGEQDVEPEQGIFMTETKEEGKTVKKKDVKVKEQKVVSIAEPPESQTDSFLDQHGNHWDAYLMSILSKNTANWIVFEKTPSGTKDQEKLSSLLTNWYGDPEHTDLVREATSDTELEPEKTEKKKTKKKWKKKEATLLEKVYDLKEAPSEAHDPYSDDNKAPFYRQPAGLRRARKHEEKEELAVSPVESESTVESNEIGAINTTAADIGVKHYQPSPPPTLRDFMNPAVGDTGFETNNMFQQEQLTGTEQTYPVDGDTTKILMASHNKYKKQLQPEFPKEPEHWFPETDKEKQQQKEGLKKSKRHERGHKRWKELPEPIDDTAELLKVLPPGYDDAFHKSADPRTRKTAKSNASLMQITPAANCDEQKLQSRTLQTETAPSAKKNIFDEWRTKWHLTGQFVDSNPQDLIKDMADIQPHVRLKAIATCAKASDYKPPSGEGIMLDFQEKQDPVQNLPEQIFVALECLLEDAVDKVRKAAAITLYSLNRPSEKAEVVMQEALSGENPVDRWAAAQCLAYFGTCDSDIVGEILKQVMTTEDTIKHERGISMLGLLSVTSRLVHSMVAEQLNSSSWRHKVIACKILPTLRGDINKDITNKLSDLMWTDWHAEVRRAAAQCLGKTGHGREVHDELRERIMTGNEQIKLEAISKVGHLGIMTAKLLPAFMKCFEDEFVSVRSEMCVTCGNLVIRDEDVVKKLVQLATFDTIWKVKALAFQALGKIGIVSDQIIDCLLWAVRYEERPGVRAEACHTLQVLRVKTEEVAEVLQDRFLVESSPVVRDEIADALKMFDISATEDMDMVAQIKREVRKLCTRNIIASQITLNEMDADRKENMARLIYQSEQDAKRRREKRVSFMRETLQTTSIPRNFHRHIYESVHEKQMKRRGCVIGVEDDDEQQQSMLERLRAMSRSVGAASSSQINGQDEGSAPPSPEPARSGVVFTPTADKELEAILSKEDLASGVTSPSDTTRSTPGAKSGKTSASSGADHKEKEDDEEESDEKEEKEKTSSSLHTPASGEADASDEDDTLSQEEEERLMRARAGKRGGEERPKSVVKFAEHLEIQSPGRPRSSVMSSTTLNEGTTKSSRMSPVFSREAVAEREKVSEEARNTFAVMDLRYRSMVSDLIDLDNAFELGLTAGSRQDFEEKIQNLQITRTPPIVPKIELTTAKEKELEVGKAEQEEDEDMDFDLFDYDEEAVAEGPEDDGAAEALDDDIATVVED